MRWRQSCLRIGATADGFIGTGRRPRCREPLPQNAPMMRTSALLPALSFVDQHFNTHFPCVRVAKLCGMTRFQFSRVFHSVFGTTFKDYLLRFRVAESCRLLRQPHACVTEVACATGFNDSSYFARIFRRYVGMLPSEYARSLDRPPLASLFIPPRWANGARDHRIGLAPRAAARTPE